jgi:hypothetical protein
MTPEEYAQSIGITYHNHYPGLECPHCNKWGVELDDENFGICPNCKAEFCEDDICQECDTLVKGGCYCCKMD